MNKRRIVDFVAIAWLAVWGYFSTLGVGFGVPESQYFWLTSPLLLIPSVLWLGWSILQHESPNPARITMESTAFVAGVLMLLIPPIVQALVGTS